MKLGGNDGTSGRYIAAKFHCSGFDSFCAALDARVFFDIPSRKRPKITPLHSRRTKTIKATAMKLGGDVGTMRGYIAAKFHRNRSSSFCAAVQ